MTQLPTEILFKIFKQLSGKELFTCTYVCKQWRYIIKETCGENSYKWKVSIKTDFDMDLEEVKTIRNMSLYNIYYNLTKWPDVAEASVRVKELYKGSEIEYIQSFLLLRDGLIAVHKKAEIVYYNINNNTVNDSLTVKGGYKQYFENDYVLVTLGNNSTLYVIRKCILSHGDAKTCEFPYVIHFTVTNEKLYYLTYDNSVCSCDLDDAELITEVHIGSYEIEMMSLKYKRKLYIMTNYLELLSCIGDSEAVSIMDPLQDYKPEDEYGALNKLYKLGLLDFMNCYLYKKILFLTKSSHNFLKIHEVTALFATANMVFVGNAFGILQVYHFPDELDFSKSKPLYEWDLSYGSKSNECPVIQIGVLENVNSHIIIAALPVKLVAIELLQKFDNIYS